jgi:hypothetical protein
MAVLFALMFAAVLAALILPWRRSRGMLAVAGALGCWYALRTLGPMEAALPFLVMLVGGG